VLNDGLGPTTEPRGFEAGEGLPNYGQLFAPARRFRTNPIAAIVTEWLGNLEALTVKQKLTEHILAAEQEKAYLTGDCSPRNGPYDIACAPAAQQ